MPWMDVEVQSEMLDGPTFKAYVNVDHIVRFNALSGGHEGSVLFLANGETLRIVDPYEEILQSVLKAESK